MTDCRHCGQGAIAKDVNGPVCPDCIDDGWYDDGKDDEPDCNCDSADAVKTLSTRIAELEAKLVKAMVGLEESQREIDRYIQFEYPLDHPVYERYRKRDFSANPARLALAEIKGETS